MATEVADQPRAPAEPTAAPAETPILDGIIEGMAWLLLGLAPLMINVYNVDAYRTIQATFTSMFIVVMVAAWAIGVTLTGRWAEVRRMPFVLPLGAFAVLAASFLLPIVRDGQFEAISPSVPLSGASWVNLVLYSLLFFVLADLGARRPAFLWRLCIPLFVAFSFNCVSGLMQHKGFTFLAVTEGRHVGLYESWPLKSVGVANYFAGLQAPSRLGSAAGTLGNQNVLGGYLTAAIPLFAALPAIVLVSWRKLHLALLLRYKNLSEGLASGLVFALAAALIANALVSFAALLATDTRGAWLGFAASLGLGLIVVPTFFKDHLARLGPATWTKLAVGAALGIALMGGLAYSAGVTPTMIKSKVMSTWTIKQRLVAWQVAGVMANERPIFGQGLGTYKINYFKYLAKLYDGREVPSYMHHRYVQAHNDFAQAAGELGYVGLLAGLGVLGLFMAAIPRHIWRCRPPPAEGILLMAALLGVFGMSVFAISGFPFHIAASSAAFTAIAAMAGASLWRERRSQLLAGRPGGTPGPVLPLEARWALTGALCFLGVLLLFFIFMPFKADERTKEGMELYKQGKVTEAGQVLQQAVLLDPERGDARLVMGIVLALMNRFPDAAQQLERAGRSYDDVTLHYYLGRVYEALNKREEARRQYLQARSYFPEGTEVRRVVEDRLAVLEGRSRPAAATGSAAATASP